MIETTSPPSRLTITDLESESLLETKSPNSEIYEAESQIEDLFHRLTKTHIEDLLQQKNYKATKEACLHYLMVKNTDLNSNDLKMIEVVCQSLLDTEHTREAREILSSLPDPELIQYEVCSIACKALANKTSETSEMRSQFLVLTGTTKEKEIVGSPELIKNIRIAKQIDSYVQSLISMPANYPLKSPQIRELVASGKITKANSLIKKNFKIQSAKRGGPNEVLSCAQRGIGSCLEMSIAGYFFALEHQLTENIECAFLENGDHAFLVIGRDHNSNPYDYTTWGDDAVLCDPWSGAHYPATLLERYLNDYVGQEFDERGLLSCHIQAFNPLTQHIHLVRNPNSVAGPNTSEETTSMTNLKRQKTVD